MNPTPELVRALAHGPRTHACCAEWGRCVGVRSGTVSADEDAARGYVVWGCQTLGCNRIWSNCASNEESSGLQAYTPIPTVDPSGSTATPPISSVVSPRRCRDGVRVTIEHHPGRGWGVPLLGRFLADSYAKDDQRWLELLKRRLEGPNVASQAVPR